MKLIKRTVIVLTVAGAVLSAGPLGAVLPPGSYESLAANAPIVIIGRLGHVFEGSQRAKTEIEVLATYRGPLKAGSRIGLSFYLTGPRTPPGPTCFTTRGYLKKGRRMLLFLVYSPKYRVYHLTAHNCKTLSLDGPVKSVMDRINRALKRIPPNVPQKLRSKLRTIYQWAYRWVLTKRK